MAQVTVITGAERRRMWTAEQKQALVMAACEPGASVAEVARRADLQDRKSTRLNSSHIQESRMPSSA